MLLSPEIKTLLSVKLAYSLPTYVFSVKKRNCAREILSSAFARIVVKTLLYSVIRCCFAIVTEYRLTILTLSF